MPGVDVASDILASFGRRFETLDSGDLDYQSSLYRPVEINEDVRGMEQRKRVSLIRQSAAFRRELESIIRSQMEVSEHPTSCHPGIKLLLSKGSVINDDSTQTSETNRVGTNLAKPICINDLNNANYTDREAMLRCKLASLFRLIDLHGWATSIYNHISMRISRAEEHFLINPFGLLYYEISASSLARINADGTIIDSGCTKYGIDPTGWVIHSAFQSISPRIRCVIHLTTPAAVTVSNVGLLHLGKESICIGPTEIFETSEILSDDETRLKLKNLLTVGKHYCKLQEDEDRDELPPTLVHVIFLRGNGLIVVGSSIEEAWYFASNAVQACEAQLSLTSLSRDQLWLPSATECVRMRERFLPSYVTAENSPSRPCSPVSPQFRPANEWYLGELEFEALMRHLDNVGFRTGHYYRSGQVGQCTRPNSPTSPVDFSGRLTSMSTPGTHSPGVNPQRTEVEVPPCAVAMGSSYQSIHESSGDGAQQPKSVPYWMASHNSYRCAREAGSDRIHWVCDSGLASDHLPPLRTIGSPLLSLQAADPAPNRFAPQGSNPSEFKEKQRKLKQKYFKDYSSPGPQSELVEGLTYEELMRLKEKGFAKISDDGSRIISLAAASRAIIEKPYRPKHPWLASAVEGDGRDASMAVMGNPFEKVTDDELRQYQLEIALKLDPQKTHMILQEQQDENEVVDICDTERVEEVKPSDQTDEEKKLPLTIEHLERSETLRPVQSVSSPQAVPPTSATLPSGSRLGALRSETSGADGSYDDTEKEGASGKDKRKKRRFKNPFSRKKKDHSHT